MHLTFTIFLFFFCRKNIIIFLGIRSILPAVLLHFVSHYLHKSLFNGIKKVFFVKNSNKNWFKVWHRLQGLKRLSVRVTEWRLILNYKNLTTTSKGLKECISRADDNLPSVKRNNTNKVVWFNLWLEQSRDIKNFDSRIYPKLLSGLL